MSFLFAPGCYFSCLLVISKICALQTLFFPETPHHHGIQEILGDFFNVIIVKSRNTATYAFGAL